MALQIVKSGATKRPDRIVLTGQEGIGKSTFAAGAPTPLFLDFEGGIAEINGGTLDCIPIATYADFKAALANWPAQHKTCVIDTLDKLEELMRQHVCKEHDWPSIESPGYGKGYVALEEECFHMLSLLDQLRERGVEIILIAHVIVSNFANPAGADYSRYSMNVHKKIAEPIRHWADVVLFACHEETVRVTKGQLKDGVLAKGKAVGTGNRIMYTEHEPAFDAKNRYGLPNPLPLSYRDFAAARAKAAGKPAPAPLEAKPQPAQVPASTDLTLAEVQGCLGEFLNATGLTVSQVQAEFITPHGAKHSSELPPAAFREVLAAMGAAYAARKVEPGPKYQAASRKLGAAVAA